MKLPEFAVRRPVTVIMIFLGIALMGVISLTRLKLDFLPDIEPPVISVLVPYPGAAASDVESDVTKYLEDQLSTVSNLDKLLSLSKDNLSMVTCQFDWGTNLDTASNDIRDKLDLARPDIREHAPDAKEPMLFKFSSATAPVMFVTVTATESSKQLYRIADKRIADPLRRIPGVGAIVLYGGDRRQINVYFDQRRLAGYRLSLPEVMARIAAENIDMPSGEVKMGTRRYQIRLAGRFKTPEEVGDVVISADKGRMIRLRDVAMVEDAFEEPLMVASSNGEDAVLLIIQKQTGANTADITTALRERLSSIKQSLPADVDYAIPMDASEFTRNSIRTLRQTLLWAGVLVVFVTVIFLRRFRASLIVIITIPFSLIVAFIFMYLMDYTINVVSLMSLSIGIGMVVDNAIVVLENITRHMEEGGERPKEAAVFATSEVGMAITASTLTTVAVFLPLIFVSGLTGIVFSELGILVTVTLAGSLFTALTLTPMLASRWITPVNEKRTGRLYRFGERILTGTEAVYERTLRISLRYRIVILGALVVVFVASLGLLQFVGSDLFPDVDSGDITINYTMDESTRLETTIEVTKQIESIITRLAPDTRDYYSFCGETEKGIGVALGFGEGPNRGEVDIKLVGKSLRDRSAKDVAEVLRNEIKTIPGIEDMKIGVTTPITQVLMGTGKQLQVDIIGHDMKLTDALAQQIRAIMERTPGAVDVTVSRKKPRQEIHIVVDRQKAATLGVDIATLGYVLRSNYFGHEVTKYRDAGDDFDILMRLHPENRRSFDDIGEVEIPSNIENHSAVKLKNIARIIPATGPVEINRKNRERIVTVGADTYRRSLGEVKADIERELGALNIPNGITVEFGGEVEEQAKAFKDLLLMLTVGLILVYMVMASQFESIKTPFIIAFSIPFAFTGVVWAFFLTGVTLSMMSFMAMIMLIGVVVNNAIVLVDYTNILRARGMSLYEAVEKAGRHRLRPVLMTTMTTLFGMLPLAVLNGEGAEMWQPFGVTAIGGLLLSTLVTLILVPIVYTLFEKRSEKRKGVVT